MSCQMLQKPVANEKMSSAKDIPCFGTDSI